MDKTQRKIERELKKRERQERRQEKIDKFVAFCEAHPLFAMCVGTALLGLITKTVTAVTRVAISEHQLKREEQLKDYRVYDRATGDYVTLNKPLTGSEQVELATRRQGGEMVTLILDDMGKIKK